MRVFRRSYRFYFLLIVFLFCCMSLPESFSSSLRGAAVSVLGKSWESIAAMKSWAKSIYKWDRSSFKRSGQVLRSSEEISRLRAENMGLRTELGRLLALYGDETLKHEKLWSVEGLSLPARVIFRDPSFWDHSLWVNVGERDNTRFADPILAENSPVLSGGAVVGLVDYVGKKQSRIRLITDPGVNPAVRVFRGWRQNALLSAHVAAVLEALSMREELFFLHQGDAHFLHSLRELHKHLQGDLSQIPLAKGTLRGAIRPAFRSPGKFLRGICFNYDFADEYGPARDLRSGQVFSSGSQNFPAVPLVQVNDLLLTSGMDGIFPEGLPVAEVTRIDPLKEGGYAYDLEARVVAEDLDHLTMVFILPPLGYDPSDQPG